MPAEGGQGSRRGDPPGSAPSRPALPRSVLAGSAHVRFRNAAILENARAVQFLKNERPLHWNNSPL